MEPSSPPGTLSQQSSCSIAVRNVETSSGAGIDAAPRSAPTEDLASPSQTRNLALRASQVDTEVPGSSQSLWPAAARALLPEVISSADLRDAQPSRRAAIQPDETLLGWEGGHTEYQPASGEAEGASAEPMPLQVLSSRVAVASTVGEEATIIEADNAWPLRTASGGFAMRNLSDLPNEVLLQILGYLDVCDLLCTSRTSHRLRDLSLAPILHAYRLRRTRAILPPMLWSPFRPSLADLIAKSIFLTNTTVVSRKLARSLVCIRLSRRLAARPSAEALVARSVLPPECVPSKKTAVAPALVAKKRAVERERVKDSLRRWVERVWRREVKERSEGVKQWEESVGIGRVWRLRRFWESLGKGNVG